ncbi:ACP S-malonyltransferase [Propionibacteriaceae bacterium Y1700]|uniref:ACP S-malonyltransferase n=1 Tax=Microlunatus sp. Y1700 TaxID=3418487 RepID=UPI003DA6F06E
MLAIVAPGQGAQKPGFLAPWLADHAEAVASYGKASDLDLVHYGTEADEDAIRDTAVAQPLLVAAGLIATRALLPTPADLDAVGVVAGHSVGELTAAAIVGALTDLEAMTLVAERGRRMAEASRTSPTSMSAVIGGQPEEVLAAIADAGLTAANNNGKGQIVAAGTQEQLAALAENPPTRARVIPLSVAGAFHTEHMAPAVPHLATLAETLQPADPRTRLLSNSDGGQVTDGREVLRRIVNQVANPVRWDLCMQTMAELGITGLLEVMPAGTLTGIAKRNLPGVELFALNTPDQVDQARDFVRQHGGTA